MKPLLTLLAFLTVLSMATASALQANLDRTAENMTQAEIQQAYEESNYAGRMEAKGMYDGITLEEYNKLLWKQ